MTCSSDRSRDNALCSRAGQPAVSGPSLPMPQPRPTPLQQPSWRDTCAKLARQHSKTISRTHYIVGCRTAQILVSSSRPGTCGDSCISGGRKYAGRHCRAQKCHAEPIAVLVERNTHCAISHAPGRGRTIPRGRCSLWRGQL